MNATVVAYERQGKRAGSDLRALVSVQVGAVIVHDCRVEQTGNKAPWVYPPARTSGGGPVIEFPAEQWAAIQRIVLTRHGEETGVYYHK